MTREELIAFEEDIAARFNAGEIKSPVHLAGGNEDQLIEIFKEIRPQDWVLCSWRSHYHCLLKGVPPNLLRDKIIAGRSIGLCFKEYRVLSSAIVGGICPIAVGIAAGIKARGEDARVWCFIGDMTRLSGVTVESMQYAEDLPLKWVVENNRFSVCTDTKMAWKNGATGDFDNEWWYDYSLSRLHVGTGLWVSF